MEEREHVFSWAALKSVQILNLEIVLNEFEFETGSVSKQSF